jgi:hypothetical protein
MTIAEPLPTPNQDPTADGFLMRLRKKNTDSKSHKATVDSYFSYWDVDRNSLEDTSSGIKKRRGGSDKLTNHFYDLVTDFYEYGTIFFYLVMCPVWKMGRWNGLFFCVFPRAFQTTGRGHVYSV